MWIGYWVPESTRQFASGMSITPFILFFRPLSAEKKNDCRLVVEEKKNPPCVLLGRRACYTSFCGTIETQCHTTCGSIQCPQFSITSHV